MNAAQSTLIYATAAQRAADEAQVIAKSVNAPFTADPMKRIRMQAAQDDAKKARRKAQTAAWEATVEFCRLNGISL